MPTNQPKHGAKLYSISELSELYDVTSRTLRHYEERGLLSPKRRGQQRFYQERDRVRLQLILRGRRLGFGLKEIQEMLDLYDADPTEMSQLQEVIRRGDVKIQELRFQIDELQTIINEILELRAKMEQRLATVRATHKDQ